MEYDVLIIDDEESVRKMFSNILEKQNYSISTAESGPDALKLLETNAYQLILLDLKMPGMSGTEVLREIRKLDRGVLVYIVTAFQHEYFEELQSIREDGIEFELLQKPIERDQLLEVVKSLLQK